MIENKLDERVHAFICDDYARYYFVEYSSLRQVRNSETIRCATK